MHKFVAILSWFTSVFLSLFVGVEADLYSVILYSPVSLFFFSSKPYPTFLPFFSSLYIAIALYLKWTQSQILIELLLYLSSGALEQKL